MAPIPRLAAKKRCGATGSSRLLARGPSSALLPSQSTPSETSAITASTLPSAMALAVASGSRSRRARSRHSAAALPMPAHSRNSEVRARSSQKFSPVFCRATASTTAVSVTISTTASTARAAQKSGRFSERASWRVAPSMPSSVLGPVHAVGAAGANSAALSR